MKPTLKIILRKGYKVKNDLQSVFLRLTINRKPKYYNLNTYVPGNMRQETMKKPTTEPL